MQRLAQRRLAEFAELLGPWRGGQCGVVVRYAGPQAAGNLLLGEDWKVRPSATLIERLEAAFGAVRLIYGPPPGSSSAVSA
jgi:DNA polymerase-3 subunit alpha